MNSFKRQFLAVFRNVSDYTMSYRLLGSLASSEISPTLCYSDVRKDLQMPVSIGGTSLKLPPTKITMKNMVLVENINELERQISSLQNDKIVKFTLKPATNENIVYKITE